MNEIVFCKDDFGNDKRPVTDTSYYGVLNPRWLTPEQVEILESYEDNK